MTEEERKLMLSLAQEFEKAADACWPEVVRRLEPARVAEDLLRKLSGVPSPQGNLFYEIISEAIPPQANRIQGA